MVRADNEQKKPKLALVKDLDNTTKPTFTARKVVCTFDKSYYVNSNGKINIGEFSVNVQFISVNCQIMIYI